MNCSSASCSCLVWATDARSALQVASHRPPLVRFPITWGRAMPKSGSSSVAASGASVPPSPRPRVKSKPRAAPVASPSSTPRKSVKRRSVPSLPSPIARPRKRARDGPRSGKRSPKTAASVRDESVLTLFKTAFTPDVKLVVPAGRLFAHEFSCLLFAFGDARFCVRETLELVEDCVREEVRRVAMGDFRSIMSRLDSRAMYRYRSYISKCRADPDPSAAATAAATCHDLPRPDVLTICTENLFASLKGSLPATDYTYLSHCRSVTFSRQESISPDPKIRGNLRANLFKKWLAIPLPEKQLLALAHLTWELTGQLVQTALLCKYDRDIQYQTPSLFPTMWNNERHWLESLGHGATTAFTIPCSEAHCARLSSEIQRFLSRPYFTTIHLRCRSRGLIPSHIYAALSRLKENGWGGRSQVRVGLYDFV